MRHNRTGCHSLAPALLSRNVTTAAVRVSRCRNRVQIQQTRNIRVTLAKTLTASDFKGMRSESNLKSFVSGVGVCCDRGTNRIRYYTRHQVQLKSFVPSVEADLR
jgi:hypothetical protein